MKNILRDYYLLILLVLIAGFFSKTAFAGEVKVPETINVHCEIEVQ